MCVSGGRKERRNKKERESWRERAQKRQNVSQSRESRGQCFLHVAAEDNQLMQAQAYLRYREVKTTHTPQ